MNLKNLNTKGLSILGALSYAILQTNILAWNNEKLFG